MNRGSEGGAEVGWAGCDVAEALIVSKTGNFLNLASCNSESAKDSANVSTHLHGDNPELVLFVDPDEEALGSVVEDSSATGPVTVQSAGLQEAISLSIDTTGSIAAPNPDCTAFLIASRELSSISI